MNKLVLLLAPAVLAGCANTNTPQYDMRFGDAVRQARKAQTLNPTASTDPIAGMDGKAVKEAIDRYHDSFKKPPPPVNVINIGGAVGGGGR